MNEMEKKEETQVEDKWEDNEERKHVMETETNGCASAIMTRLNEFQSKQIKYLQQEMDYLVRNNDSYYHLIDARFDICKRVFLANIRSRKRLQ
ncbi:hypothetical protein RFI_27013, partial [Reticulomyxa filosa]